ncbi:hypothetical protein D3C85_912490 [compost metagenome]
MFDRNIFIIHFFGNDFGFVQSSVGYSGELYFTTRNFRETLNGAIQYLKKQRHVDVQFFQNKGSHIFVYFKNGFKDMFVFYLLLTQTLNQLLRKLYGFLRFNGKFINVHD